MAKKFVVVYKAGTAGSGHFSHAGRPGKTGGSLPKGGAPIVHDAAWFAARDRFNHSQRAYDKAKTAAKKAGLSDADALAAAKAARAAAYAEYDAMVAQTTVPGSISIPQQTQYRGGKYANVLVDRDSLRQYNSDDLYDMSSQEIKDLADKTGLLALDEPSEKYIRWLESEGKTDDPNKSRYNTGINYMDHMDQARRFLDVNSYASPANDYGFGSPLIPDKVHAKYPQDPQYTGKYDLETVPALLGTADDHARAYIESRNAELAGQRQRAQANWGYSAADAARRYPDWDINNLEPWQVQTIRDDRDTTAGFQITGLNDLTHKARKYGYSQLAQSTDAITKKYGEFMEVVRDNEVFANRNGIAHNLDAPEPVPFMQDESIYIGKMVGAYRTALAEGKWPVYGESGSTVTRWARMTKAERVEVEDHLRLIDSGKETIAQFQSFHQDMIARRPALLGSSNKTERYFPDGDKGFYMQVAGVMGRSQDFSFSGKMSIALQSNYSTVSDIMKAQEAASAMFQTVKPDGRMTFATLTYLNMPQTNRTGMTEVFDRVWKINTLNTDSNSPIRLHNEYLRRAGLNTFNIGYDDINWGSADARMQWDNYLDQGINAWQKHHASAPVQQPKNYHEYTALADGSAEKPKMTAMFDKIWDRTQLHHGQPGTIHEIFYVAPSKKVREGYDWAVKDHDNEYASKIPFHATSHWAAGRIAATGFRIDIQSTGTMLGSGVYSSTMPSKVAQYVSGRFSSGMGRGVIFALKIAAGKTFNLGTDTCPGVGLNGCTSGDGYNKIKNYGYHSLYAPKGIRLGNYGSALLNNEATVFDPRSAMPDLWIDYERK